MITPLQRSLAAVAITACVSMSAAAQSSSDVAALKQQVEALQQQVQEIVNFLRAQGIPIGMNGMELDIAGAPARGPASAHVVLVEYSDYLCPFCGRYARETWPQIEKEYVATGKLRTVFKDFPVEQLHPPAPKVHEAAYCAAEQSKFWEMHDLLFEKQDATTVPDLVARAGTLGLDTTAFKTCLESGKHTDKLRRAVAEGRPVVVGGTPMFFIGIQQPNGKVKVAAAIVGAQPLEQFRQAIESVLAKQPRG